MKRESKMIEIIYPEEKYFPSFHNALSEVAKERIYIEMLEPPPLQKVTEFQKSLMVKNGPVYYAVDNGKVVGWCDIFPSENPRFSHRGSLGMGLLKDYRGKGLGKKLLEKTIAHAKKFGLEKVELSVYTSNIHAIKLYKNLGFQEEGLIKKYRKLDGNYFDCLVMGLFF